MSVLFAGTMLASPRAKHVFVISIDQGNPDAIQEYNMPVVQEMARDGAHTWTAYTIVPSVTLPSHTSMLTGVGLQKHQIDWNRYTPENGLVQVPTIFSLAKERGFVTAMFVGKEKLKHLDIPGSLDLFIWPQPDDTVFAVANAVVEKVGKLKPNLTFIHFADPDVMGHRHGIHSPEKIQALEDTDTAIGMIKKAVADAGMLEDSVFIISADHGSHDKTKKDGKIYGTHGSSKPEDVTIPWIVWGKGVKSGTTITAPVLQYSTAATALWLLDVPVPESFWAGPVTSAFENGSRVSASNSPTKPVLNHRR